MKSSSNPNLFQFKIALITIIIKVLYFKILVFVKFSLNLANAIIIVAAVN